MFTVSSEPSSPTIHILIAENFGPKQSLMVSMEMEAPGKLEKKLSRLFLLNLLSKIE